MLMRILLGTILLTFLCVVCFGEYINDFTNEDNFSILSQELLDRAPPKHTKSKQHLPNIAADTIDGS